MSSTFWKANWKFASQFIIRISITYLRLKVPRPSHHHHRERERAARKERARRRRGIKKQKRVVSLLPRCLLAAARSGFAFERVALNATSFVWFPIVERAHTRATFDDDDEGHRDDATSKHASVEKRVLCTAAEKSRVR